MKSASPTRAVRRGEEGYALLLIMFFLALLVLSTVTLAPTVISDIQREKEAEMVWRGKQYVRGVRLYYQKLHRFPHELDDLTKAKLGIRFMRQAYKDPMNSVDGSWRLIYVGPSGQLIGSLKNRCVSLMGQPTAPSLAGAGAPTTSSSFGSGSNSSSASSFGSSSFSTSFNPGGSPATIASTGCGQASGASGDPNAPNPDANDEPGTPHDITSSEAPVIMGGNIIGVGSKVDKKSFLWYEKARNYRQFEFIWDPSKDVLTGRQIGTFGVAPGTFGTGAPGVSNPNSPSSQGNNPNPGQTQNPPGNLDPSQQTPLQAPPD